MMVRWICGVSLKHRKRSEFLYSLSVFRAWLRCGRFGGLGTFGGLDG